MIRWNSNILSVLFFVCTIGLSNWSIAEQVAEKTTSEFSNSEPSKSNEIAQEGKPIVAPLSEEEPQKYNYFFNLKYAYLDLLIPSKYGFSIGYIKSEERTWEFEYLKGSFSIPFLIKDLGKMSDERYSINTRSYSKGSSFNIMYGVSYNDFSFVLGDKLLNKLSGGLYPSINLVEVQSLGFNFSLGNRWVFKNRFTLSMDWFSWSQPLVVVKKNVPYLDYATDTEDREIVEDSIKYISYFPRFGAFKINLGIYF